MLRRLIYALGAAAVALGIAAGVTGAYPAIAVQIADPPNTIPPGIVAPDSDPLAGFKTRAGGTEIAVSHPLRSTPGVVLAGFNNTKVEAEIYY